MARIRTVKPELFLDEELGNMSGDHNLLFIGLLTQADKEGRLEDRPTRLKAALFPYRKADVDALLADLERVGKIQRYEADGVRCIAIPGFTKHQRPHPKEPASELPPPQTSTKRLPLAGIEVRSKDVLAGYNSESFPSSPVGREGKGREGDLEREGKGTAASPPPPVSPPAAQDPEAGALQTQISDAFRQARGGSYEWRTADETALRGLVKHPPEEILRRWRIGLRRDRYPICNGVPDLLRHWNAYAADAPSTAPIKKPDVPTERGAPVGKVRL